MAPARKLLHCSIVVLFFSAALRPAAAQTTVQPFNQQPPVKDIEYLDYLLDLTVASGSFLDLNLHESPFSMTVISREQIQISGARHMSELLEVFVPGFQYLFNKWNGTLWGMRGVANDRNTKILYLVNGHKMNTQARDGFQGETVLGLLGDIERVEVLRGPAGLVYGSGAIAGIINVVTRSGTTNSTEVGTAFSTSGTQSIDANIFASPAPDHTIAVSAGFLRSDGLEAHRSRIYGSGPTPFPQNGGNTNGVPSDGNFGSTDGNWRVSTQWDINNFDLYLRATRQKENAGGWFILDPWPDKMAPPDSTFSPVFIEGEFVSPEDPFWSQTESWRINRLQYQSDNFMAEGNYTVPFGENRLQMKLGYDLNTTRIGTEKRPGYESDYCSRRTGFVSSTFGESRYSADAQFLLKSIADLQLATGAQYRLDRIGGDMEGNNRMFESSLVPTVATVNYHTLSFYSECLYALSPEFDMHMGGRLDFHTRAFMANPKLAFIYKPTDQHSIKLICQSSSNNGSADNYEYNRFHYSSDGSLNDKAVFARTWLHPLQSDEILQPVQPLDSLHKLQPEKVYCAELAYTGVLSEHITVAPSASIGYVKDLFNWSQKLFRVVNAGNYKYFNLDLDAKFESRRFSIGASHTYQRPWATDVAKQKRYYRIEVLDTAGVFYDSIPLYTMGDTTLPITGYTYTPRLSAAKSNYPINIVENAITADGMNFLNLHTNVTKCYITFMPYDWLALHMNVRLFWGLWGRRDIYADDEAYNYLNSADRPADLGVVDYLKRSVEKKVNTSLHLFLSNGFGVSFYVYDLFGIDRPNSIDTRNYTVNTLRWSYMTAPDQKELYSTDQRRFGIQIGKSF